MHFCSGEYGGEIQRPDQIRHFSCASQRRRVISKAIQELINNNLKLLLHGKATLLNLDDLGFNGYPNKYYYRDSVHFNKHGTSVLAYRLKKAIHKNLNII